MIKRKYVNNSLLWQITNVETEKVSYIYGTIHLRDESVYFIIDKVKKLIRECDIFMAEYPLDDAGDGKIMEMLQIPDGKHLRDFIPKKKYDKLNKFIKKSFHIDLERLGFFRPMVIENMLTESLFESDYDYPMDIVLWNFAKDLDLEVLGAETTISQLEIMQKLSLKKQLKSLIEIGKNTSKFRKKIKKLITYYKEQNLTELHRKSMKSLGRMKEILVYQRNENIVDSILKYSKDKRIFVAIGAGHLLGKKGVLRLLKSNGYKIKPIT